MKRLAVVCIPIVVFLFCALRDNPCDPGSPFRRPILLSLTLHINTDTVEIDSDTSVNGYAPFRTTFSSSVDDQSGSEPQPGIMLEHYLNDSLWYRRASVPGDTSITFKQFGNHRLRFFSMSKNGMKSEKNVEISVDTLMGPRFLSFEVINDDPFELIPSGDSRKPAMVVMTFVDSNSLIDSTLVMFSDNLQHPFSHTEFFPDENFIVTDTVLYNFSPDKDSIHGDSIVYTVTGYLVDKCGRATDTQTTTVKIVRGAQVIGHAPTITGIKITDINDKQADARSIREGEILNFEVDAMDWDGHLDRWIWEFRSMDSAFRHTTRKEGPLPPCAFTFDTHGKWTVSVTVRDDKGNSSRFEMDIEVLPNDGPLITEFTVENDSGPYCLRPVVTVKASDADGIKQVVYVITSITDPEFEPISDAFPELPVVKDSLPNSLCLPGTYLLQINVHDSSTSSTGTSKIVDTIRVTEAVIGPKM